MAQSAQISSLDLAKRVDQASADSAGVISAITGAYGEIQSLGNVRAEAVVNVGAADSLIVGTKELGELRRQEAAVAAATVIGTNMSDASELITSLGLESREKFARAEAARKVYYKNKNTSFFDDPLGWIGTNLLGGDDKSADAYNEAAQDYNATVQRLDTINAQTTAAAQAQAAIVQTRTAASVEAAAESVRLKAAETAGQIKQQNLLYNVQGLETVQRLKATELANLFHLNSAVMSEKNLAISAANLKLSQENHKLALEARTDRIEQKKADREEIETLGATINAGRASLGLAEIPVGKAIQLMKMGGETGDMIKQQYGIGANITATGKPFIADNSGTAARIIVAANAPLSAAAKPLRDVLVTAYKDTLTNPKLTIDKKDPKQVDVATKKLVDEITSGMAANIKAGDATNIYAAPKLTTIAEIAPGITQTALYQKVLQDVAPSMQEVNPLMILNLARNGVQTRKITFEEAVSGITTLFNGAIATNNAAIDYLRAGVKPQVGFITTVQTQPSVPGIGGNVTVNMADSVSVSNAFSKVMMTQTVIDRENLRRQTGR